MDTVCEKRVEANDNHLITAVFSVEVFPEISFHRQVIYFPPDWDITHPSKHWSTEETEHHLYEKPALVIMDNYKFCQQPPWRKQYSCKLANPPTLTHECFS